MIQTLFTLARFSLLEAIRSRIGWLMVVFIGTSASLAWFVGQIAITETNAVQAAITASFLRFTGVLLISMFVITSYAREVADKGLDLLLSLPIPRAVYYLGKLLGFICGAWILAIVCGLLLLFLAPANAVIAWIISFALELSIVTAASLFLVTTLTQVTVALMAVIGFYCLSRAMAALQLISNSSLLQDNSMSHTVIETTLNGIAMLLPRLDLFTQSNWLTDPGTSISLLLTLGCHAIIYIVLLSAAGLLDLYRKSF